MNKQTIGSLVALCVLLNSAVVIAQQEETSEGWEEYLEASPFPTDLITVPSWRFARGPHVRAAFRDVVKEPSGATVRVRAEGEKVAYGGILRSDGLIVTKASQLRGEITCLLADKRRFEAKVLAMSREFDIALLKIEAKDLPVMKFAEAEQPDIGAWLATVGIDRDPVAVGVMSVEPREIAHRAGVLGIRLHQNRAEAVVAEVYRDTGAERAGLEEGDVMLSINERKTPTVDGLIQTVREYSPGDKVRVELRRKGVTQVVDVILTGNFPIFPQSREEFQNQLGGDLSRRRFGFPDAFQHDTVLKPSDCGGPVVNLDGEVVGINLARAGRTETYAISTGRLEQLVEELLDEGDVQ